MPISFVNAAVDGSPTGASFSITLPATAANDILCVALSIEGTDAAPSLGGTYSGGSWTTKQSLSWNGTSFRKYLYWSRATTNHTGETVTASFSSSQHAEYVAIYRGCLTSGDPLAEATVVAEANASGNEDCAALTTTNDGAMICVSVANPSTYTYSSWAATDPSSLTERVDSTINNSRIAHASALQGSAGSTGTISWTQSFNSISGSIAWALTPAASSESIAADLTASFSTLADDFTVYAYLSDDLSFGFSNEASHALTPNPISANLSYGVGTGATATTTLNRYIKSNLVYGVNLDRPTPSGVPFISNLTEIVRRGADHALKYKDKILKKIDKLTRRY